jgi:hypothetical protein
MMVVVVGDCRRLPRPTRAIAYLYEYRKLISDRAMDDSTSWDEL